MVLSSKQAAEILGVNESSVKRWSDNGMLSCYRTPGGHRKFRREDLLLFSRKYSYELKEDIAGGEKPEKEREQDTVSAYRLLYNKLVSGSEDDILEYLYSLYLTGTDLTELYDNVTAGAMREIGSKWRKKDISIEQEHIATSKMIRVLIRLQDKITKKPFNGLTALCASLEGEYHELPVLMSGNALAYFGWKVIYAGVNLPVKALQSGINEYKPDAVCISATIINNTKTYSASINRVKTAVNATGGKLILGGAGISKLNGQAKAADTVVTSIGELIKYLKNNFPF